MLNMRGRPVARAAAAVAVAVVGLSGCWSQVGANAGRTRHNAVEDVVTAANVATLTEAWSAEIEGAMREPVAAGGRVHVGSTGGPVDAFIRVDTFDLRTGALRWGRRLVSGADSFMLENSGVALSGPYLWAGYLLAANQTSGECPVATLRLDPATGATTSSECDVWSTVPATAAGSIAVNSVVGPGESRLRVIDAETGELRFTGQLAASPTIPPLIGGGQVVVLDRTSVAAYPVDGCGAPQCAPTWRMDPTPMFGSVSVTDALVAPDGSVYFTFDASTGGSYVMAVTAAGAFRWMADFDRVWDMALAGDTVYAAVTDGGDDGVVALDAGGCGVSQWCGTVRGYLVAGGARGLAVAGGVVYTGSAGAVVAFPEDCPTSSCPPLAEVPVAGRVQHVVVSDGHVLAGSIRDDGTQVLTALAPG
jgi:hypothetical protein